MNRFWIPVLACALLAAPAAAQNNSAPRGAGDRQPLETTRDKASYAIGLQVGKNMAQQRMDLNPAMVARGIVHGLQKQEPLLTAGEIQAVMQAFATEMADKLPDR